MALAFHLTVKFQAPSILAKVKRNEEHLMPWWIKFELECEISSYNL